MPIYAYRCASCGHAKDVLQRMSDPLLTTCPACGAEAFTKQVTAAGFQLKGSGWYVTDFKGNGSAPAAVPPVGDSKDKPAASDKPDSADKSGDKAASPAASAAPAPAPSAAPAAGSPASGPSTPVSP